MFSNLLSSKSICSVRRSEPLSRSSGGDSRACAGVPYEIVICVHRVEQNPPSTAHTHVHRHNYAGESYDLVRMFLDLGLIVL